jgi:FkbM family methyltransferase
MVSIRKIRMYCRIVGVSGFARAINAKVTRSTGYCSVRRLDYQYPFRLRVPSSDVDAYEQIFINQEYDFALEKEPKVIVDAGANIGLASIYFANKCPEAKIFAIEPEISNFELLKENVRPYPQVIPIHAALWNRSEELILTDPGLGKWGFMTENKNEIASQSRVACHPVMAVTINDLLDDYGLESIDILKVDIEGAEREVFEDSSSWIERVDSIIIELHERLKIGCNRSFYCGSRGFHKEWQQGENVYLSRGCLARRSGN